MVTKILYGCLFSLVIIFSMLIAVAIAPFVVFKEGGTALRNTYATWDEKNTSNDEAKES